jgi:hypothetical protein
MAERIILLDGEALHAAFLGDLSQVMEHQYDIDEIYCLYGDWCRRGELFVDEFVAQLFPPEVKETAEDFIALRNAMINLYCTIDRSTQGLDRRSVTHAAYSEQDRALVLTSIR